MCLAVPGKVKKVAGKLITVSYPKENRDVFNGGIEVEVGDYVLVQMGVIVKKIPEKEAKIALKLWGGK